MLPRNGRHRAAFVLPPVAFNGVPLRAVKPGFVLLRRDVGLLAVVFAPVLELPHTGSQSVLTPEPVLT